MSTENNIVETDDTSLDDFSAEFFGQNEAEPSSTKPEVEEEVADSEDAQPDGNDQDTQNVDDSDDTPDEDEEDTEDDTDEVEEEAPKPKKKTAQERISELTAARREAERRADALEARLAALEKPAKDDTPAPAPSADAEATPPKPTDLNEDGSEKYPLGEFDPNFITDLADFRVEQRFAARERIEQEKAAQAKQQEAMDQLEAKWNGQLETARERYPDYNEKLSELQPVFSDVDEHYGDYLSTTLMSMEKGADILYYLAENPDEARAIVDSGPQRATIALGRLEARFLSDGESKPVRKVSKAPVPPPVNKGAAIARAKVTPDTDDLDAFETIFFQKK